MAFQGLEIKVGLARRVVYNGLEKLVKLSGPQTQVGQGLDPGADQPRMVHQGGQHDFALLAQRILGRPAGIKSVIAFDAPVAGQSSGPR